MARSGSPLFGGARSVIVEAWIPKCAGTSNGRPRRPRGTTCVMAERPRRPGEIRRGDPLWEDPATSPLPPQTEQRPFRKPGEIRPGEPGYMPRRPPRKNPVRVRLSPVPPAGTPRTEKWQATYRPIANMRPVKIGWPEESLAAVAAWKAYKVDQAAHQKIVDAGWEALKRREAQILRDMQAAGMSWATIMLETGLSNGVLQRKIKRAHARGGRWPKRRP